MLWKRALDAISSVVFAAPCRICGNPLTNASRVPICLACLDSFERISAPLCHLCGHPFAQPFSGPGTAQLATFSLPVVAAITAPSALLLCRLCRKGTYGFDRARSFAVYSDALFEAIILMKYEEVTRLGFWFAGRLAQLEDFSAEAWRPDAVVPVPLHPERRRERGYNQAELIARPLAKLLRIPLKAGLLIRTKSRPSQLLLSRHQRWESVRGAYAAPGRRAVDLRVLLVDDVLTTGATLDACARALKKAGAASVTALTVGRVVPEWSRQSPEFAGAGAGSRKFIGVKESSKEPAAS
jgi:ComF family protein